MRILIPYSVETLTEKQGLKPGNGYYASVYPDECYPSLVDSDE